jgi:hypothetical protein
MRNFNHVFLTFLGYFQILKKYAIVRTLSVRLSVCRATTFQGVDRSCSFMAQSIAYDPRAWTKEGNFFRPILAPTGGVRSLSSIHFHMKIRFYWYLRRVMSLMLDLVGRGSKVPSDPNSAPDPKSVLRPKKCSPTQKVPSDQKVPLYPKVLPTQKVPPNPKSAPRP